MKFYDEMFKALTNLKSAMKPMIETMDFDPVAIVGIRTTFSQVNVKGCFFRLCQLVYRAVVRFGLKTNYTDDLHFAQHIRALPSLAFLYVNDVTDTFEE